MADWIESALADAGKLPAGQSPGSIAQACPQSTPPFILVRTVRSDTGEPLGGVDVRIEGPTAGSKKTASSNGACVFDPVKPGAYRVQGSLTGAQAEQFEAPEPVKFSVEADGFSAQILLFAPQAKLKVRVFKLGTGSPPCSEPVSNVTVRVFLPAGRGQRKMVTDAAGVADFGRVPAGSGRIEVQTVAAYPDQFSPVAPVRIQLEATHELVVPIELEEPLELQVTPQLEDEDELEFIVSTADEDEMAFECIVVESGEDAVSSSTSAATPH